MIQLPTTRHARSHAAARTARPPVRLLPLALAAVALALLLAGRAEAGPLIDVSSITHITGDMMAYLEGTTTNAGERPAIPAATIRTTPSTAPCRS